LAEQLVTLLYRRVARGGMEVIPRHEPQENYACMFLHLILAQCLANPLASHSCRLTLELDY